MTTPWFFETSVSVYHGVTSQKTWIYSNTAARIWSAVANVCQPKARLPFAVSSRATYGLPNPFSITRNDISSPQEHLLAVEDRNVVVSIDGTVLSSSFSVMFYRIWDLSSSVIIMWHRVTGLCHHSSLEDDTAMLSRSVCHRLPSDAASHPKERTP
jgi:hypothetical protein